jgi:hypothetical protein
MNPNYAPIFKHDLDKLLNVDFIVPMEEASWLSPIVVVPKKMVNSKSAWISSNSMLLPRRIHILYRLLKRYWLRWEA